MEAVQTQLEYLASKLRECRSLPEFQLWEALKKADFITYRFQRQQLISNYIVDIYCADLNLVIEIDGDTHDMKFEQAAERYAKMKDLGMKVLRFTNNELKRNMKAVVKKIVYKIQALEQEQLCGIQQPLR